MPSHYLQGHRAGEFFRGSLRDSDNYLHLPALPVRVVDTTGAGDAFCGGLLAHLAKGCDAMEALCGGIVSASFCVEEFGLAGLLSVTQSDAQYRLAQLQSSLPDFSFCDMPRHRCPAS